MEIDCWFPKSYWGWNFKKRPHPFEGFQYAEASVHYQKFIWLKNNNNNNNLSLWPIISSSHNTAEYLFTVQM